MLVERLEVVEMKRARSKNTLTEFGLAAKKRMMELNMSDAYLATRLGIKRPYLTFIFYGQRSGAKYIEGIVNILGLDPKFFKKTEERSSSNAD